MSIYTCLCGDYTFFVFYNSVTTEVFPLGFLETLLDVKPEKDQQFYSREFTGELTFGGRGLRDDFDLFWTIEQSNPCGRIDFLILRDLDVYWTGYFSTSKGKFDLDKCTFTVRPETEDDYSPWREYGDLEFNILDVAPAVTVECNGHTYTKNRWLFDVIEYLADQVFPGCTVTSIFFTAMTDYVTLLPSKLHYLTIASKADIKGETKNPGGFEAATFVGLSFNGLMDILRIMFNVYWTYDATTDVLRVEHVSYFTYTSGLDLRADKMAAGSNVYRYSDEKMPKYEIFNPAEGRSADFVYGQILYDTVCVNQDNEANRVEYSVPVTTEIEIIQDDDFIDSISGAGFVILCNYLSGGNYYTYNAPGLIDTVTRYNQYLSWSYLLYAYHRHDRILLEGYMNGILQTFVSMRPNKIQEVNTIVCGEFNPEDYITTELGETYLSHAKGWVDKASMRPTAEINFSLLYGEPDNANPGITLERLFAVRRDDLQLYIELNTPALDDMYFSVLTNDGLAGEQCDQFVVLAGTMYQEETLTQINPIVTIEWNFTHASFTDWLITVDGSTTFDTCTNVDCSNGAPAPPPVPGIPTFIGAQQHSTCGYVDVQWNAEADATYYILQRKPDYDLNDNWITVDTTVNTYYYDYDAGTHDGVEYKYRLKACNVSGCSDWSSELSYTPYC